MARTAWKVVEHWQARSEMGLLDLWLLRADGPDSKSWRVEWLERNGYRKGVTFGGEDRQQRARAELDRRKNTYMRIWQQVDSEALK